MKSQILSMEREQILERSEECFCRICGRNEGKKKEDSAFRLRECYKEQLIPKIVIKDSGGEKIYYAMCIEDLNDTEGVDLLDQFYLDCWMTALLDAARLWLGNYLSEREKEKGSPFRVSGPAGPGFGENGLETMQMFLALSEGEKIGISIKDGMLHPLKSNVGYYTRTEEKSESGPDCSHCMSGRKNCQYCMNNREK